ncbi:MAG TPA: VWA domain-containing protein [Pyrinomonadaceae bacterium]|nr:VWA domain-containing protein [Pyrinomonadaceae bacterium]
MKLQNLTISLFLLFLSALTIFAQQPSETPPVDDKDSIKISTTLIQVDVTVTDKDGKIVTDLKPEDFEVYENGKKQTITNFSFISVNKPAEKINPQPVKPDKNAVPIPPVRLKSEQVRRTYALVVDDLGLNFGNVYWVQQSLRKFINEQMQEGDLVAIVRTGSGIGALQSFTSDKRQLLAGIDKIKWNSFGRSGVGTFAPIGTTLKEDLQGSKDSDGKTKNPEGADEDKEFQRQTDEFRNENFSVGTLGALNYIIRGMRELPGRKAVVLFSEGFVLTSNGQPSRVFDKMRVLADLANRSSVVIYTIDPRGLQVPGMANADDDIRQVIPENFDPATFDDGRGQREQDFTDSQQSLRYLAYQTGGVPFINQNNIDKGLRQAVNDQSSYYLLGYQPDDESFDPKKAKFNKLEVKLTRPGLKIRYRSGFFGITDEKIQNIAQTPQQKLLTALTSPFSANGINLSLYPVFQNDAKNGDLIQALVFIDAKDLQFTKTAAGQQKAVFDIVAMTFGDNGITVDRLSKTFTLEISEKTYRNLLEKGFVYTLSVPIKKAGAYQFRIALRDTVSDKIGSASQFIEVPNVKKRLVLSNIVLDNFTLNEWQKIKLGGSPDESERSLLYDAALRQYKRGTILRYDYAIYNPNQTRQIETRLRLIKDGKVVYEENPTAVKTDDQKDLQRIQAAGAVSLGKDLEVGNYVLQVIATDKTDAKKFASQFVEFEIVK